MSKEALLALAPVIEEADLIVLSDELYAELTYDGVHCSPASLPELKERTVLVSGFSKAFAMTGWRLGYTVAPDDILQAMLKIHRYAIMSAPTAAQYAALEALKNGIPDVIEMREEYKRRRDYLCNTLNMLGIDCYLPKGAFYAFPDIKKFGLSSDEFCDRLLMEQKLAIIPGNAFGECGEGYARICYANSIENIERAMFRLEQFIKEL
jgi:aminotransferase